VIEFELIFSRLGKKAVFQDRDKPTPPTSVGNLLLSQAGKVSWVLTGLFLYFQFLQAIGIDGYFVYTQ